MTSAVGSAGPLIILHPEEIGQRDGIWTWIGLVVVIIGLVFLAKSGFMKDREQQQEEYTPLLLQEDPLNPVKDDAPAKSSFKVGLIICLVSGILSPMLNFMVAFGAGVSESAIKHGSSPLSANNALWALGVSAGSIANICFCVYKLFKNNTWKKFVGQTAKIRVKNASLAALMGLLWFSGNIIYGVGMAKIGSLGAVSHSLHSRRGAHFSLALPPALLHTPPPLWPVWRRPLLQLTAPPSLMTARPGARLARVCQLDDHHR